MLSPKSSAIAANNGAFDATSRGLWLPVLVGSRLYHRYAQGFTDIQVKLDAVQNGTLQAKQLNEAMVLIDRIGPVDASESGTEGEYSTLDNREGFIEYAMAVLYGRKFWPRHVAGGSVATPIRIRW